MSFYTHKDKIEKKHLGTIRLYFPKPHIVDVIAERHDDTYTKVIIKDKISNKHTSFTSFLTEDNVLNMPKQHLQEYLQELEYSIYAEDSAYVEQDYD